MLLALTLGQLVLVESGFACTTPPREPCDMAMVAGANMDAGTDAPSDDSTPRSNTDSSCRFPWAPSGCLSAVPCGPAAVPQARSSAENIAAAPPSAPDRATVTPESVSRPPALPPPRA